MTHKDIYIKFMIEYDKANVTSSYPSLTEYEVATVLDKAYNALIAQKVTGNNVRRAPFEADVKSISDLQALVVTKDINPSEQVPDTNVAEYSLEDLDFLYYVSAKLKKFVTGAYKEVTVKTGVDSYGNPQYTTYTVVDESSDKNPIDGITTRPQNVRLVNHDIASKFIITSSNMPWVKEPVAYIENDHMYVVYDSVKPPVLDPLTLTYIKKPNRFVKNLSDSTTQYASFFDYASGASSEVKAKYQFELNDTMAEELVSLAISFALENIESPRLNSKLNMRGLES